MDEQTADSTMHGPLRRRLRAALAALFMFATLSQAVADPVRIGVTVTDLGNPFFVRLARSIENSARQVIGPDVKVFVASSAYDLTRQMWGGDRFGTPLGEGSEPGGDHLVRDCG